MKYENREVTVEESDIKDVMKLRAQLLKQGLNKKKVFGTAVGQVVKLRIGHWDDGVHIPGAIKVLARLCRERAAKIRKAIKDSGICDCDDPKKVAKQNKALAKIKEPKYCPQCSGYGSSLKEKGDRCSKCNGTGIKPGSKLADCLTPWLWDDGGCEHCVVAGSCKVNGRAI